MGAHIEDVLLWITDQVGAPYIFGAENESPPPPHIEAADCSELIQNGCDAVRVAPPMPDGAYYQWRHCVTHGPRISVTQALQIRGALVFMGDLTGVGRDAVYHVAIVVSPLRTFEARSSRYPIGFFDHADRRGWSAAGLIPGVDYRPRTSLPPSPKPMAIPPIAPPSQQPEDAMFTYDDENRNLYIVAGGKQVRLTGKEIGDRVRASDHYIGVVGADEQARFTKAFGAPIEK